MPTSINLLKAFEKGYLIHFKLGPTEYKGPEPGRCWLLLGGNINHVDTEMSRILVSTEKAGYAIPVEHQVFRTDLPATTPASGWYPIFGTGAYPTHAQFQLVIIDSSMFIYFGGGGGSYAVIQVLEWTP